MKNLIVGTGGYVIQADSFASSLFVQSFKRIWEKDEKEQIDMNFNATVEIKTSREVKVCGMIGAGTSLKANSSSVSENEMGVGGTSQWRLPALNSQTSLAFLLEVVNQVRSSDSLANSLDQSESSNLFSIMPRCHKAEKVLFNLSLAIRTLVVKLGFVSQHWPDRGRILKLV